VAQNYQKSWGEFNSLKFFIFPFTISSCVARVSYTRTQKVKLCRKCVAMQSICIGTFSDVGTYFFGREMEDRKLKFFCSKTA